jgi:hypothetical protein
VISSPCLAEQEARFQITLEGVTDVKDDWLVMGLQYFCNTGVLLLLLPAMSRCKPLFEDPVQMQDPWGLHFVQGTMQSLKELHFDFEATV